MRKSGRREKTGEVVSPGFAHRQQALGVTSDKVLIKPAPDLNVLIDALNRQYES